MRTSLGPQPELSEVMITVWVPEVTRHVTSGTQTVIKPCQSMIEMRMLMRTDPFRELDGIELQVAERGPGGCFLAEAPPGRTHFTGRCV